MQSSQTLFPMKPLRVQRLITTTDIDVKGKECWDVVISHLAANPLARSPSPETKQRVRQEEPNNELCRDSKVTGAIIKEIALGPSRPLNLSSPRIFIRGTVKQKQAICVERCRQALQQRRPGPHAELLATLVTYSPKVFPTI